MSAWLEHVKKTMKMNKGKPLKEVLVIAKKTYKSGKKTASHKVARKPTRKTAKKSTRKVARKASRKVARKSRRGRR
jgi:hypothetical protein